MKRETAKRFLRGKGVRFYDRRVTVSREVYEEPGVKEAVAVIVEQRGFALNLTDEGLDTL